MFMPMLARGKNVYVISLDVGGAPGSGVSTAAIQLNSDGTFSYNNTPPNVNSVSIPARWGDGGTYYGRSVILTDESGGFAYSDLSAGWTLINAQMTLIQCPVNSATPGEQDSSTGTWEIATDAAGLNIIASGSWTTTARCGTF